MPTISSKINSKELDAITEYANACGETVSNLIRKCLLSEATFMPYYRDSNDYNYSISVPDNTVGDEEDRIVLRTVNKVRRILGLKEQEEI